jgi:hypothetical protein
MRRALEFVGRRALVIVGSAVLAGCVALEAQAGNGAELKLLGGKPGASPGVFKGSFAVNVRSDCFTQASSGDLHSNRAYFRVR